MTRESHRSSTLLVALVLRLLRGAHFESMGGPWRPKLGFFALLAMVQGTLGMYNHSNWHVMKCNGHTGFSRIWTLCRQNASVTQVTRPYVKILAYQLAYLLRVSVL